MIIIQRKNVSVNLKKEMSSLVQLEFKKVSYSPEGKTILNNISIAFSQGDYVSIVGPSGSGKSTFLKLCCHLISATDGSIFTFGSDVTKQNPIELRKRISYCFQNPVLFGETVEENLAFPYTIRNQKMDMETVSALFSRFSMEESFIKQKIQNLSGGEKQRIALIRTLLFKPEILLLDEVTSALDADNAAIVENAIQVLNQDGITVLWVTHNEAQSRKNAGKLMTIENGRIKSLEVLK